MPFDHPPAPLLLAPQDVLSTPWPERTLRGTDLAHPCLRPSRVVRPRVVKLSLWRHRPPGPAALPAPAGACCSRGGFRPLPPPSSPPRTPACTPPLVCFLRALSLTFSSVFIYSPPAAHAINSVTAGALGGPLASEAPQGVLCSQLRMNEGGKSRRPAGGATHRGLRRHRSTRGRARAVWVASACLVRGRSRPSRPEPRPPSPPESTQGAAAGPSPSCPPSALEGGAPQPHTAGSVRGEMGGGAPRWLDPELRRGSGGASGLPGTW